MVNSIAPMPHTDGVRRADFDGGTAQVSPPMELEGSPSRQPWYTWTLSQSSPKESARRQSGSRASGVVHALSCVIQELVLVKYGVALDSNDLNRKISSHCRGCRKSEDVSSVLSPIDVVHELNLRSTDLRFRTLDADRSLALHIESRMIDSFKELQTEVRRMPGTARTLAIVVPLSLDLRSVVDEEDRARAIAVFREDYGRPNLLVGRDVEPGSQAPLNSFSSANLQCAMLIDPIIDKVCCHEALGSMDTSCGKDSREIAAPSLREEYASLGIMLLPEESRRTSPPRTEVAHIAVYPWQQILEAALHEDGGPAPTQRWMWRMRRVLEHPDASSEALLQLLTQIAAWLQGGGAVAADVQLAISTAGLPPGLILLLQRFLLEHAEPKSPTRRVELSITMQICRIIALSCKGFPECAAAFTQTHAMSTLCSLMQRWPENGDIQLSAMYAINALVEEDTHAAAKAVSSGAMHWVRVAANMHPKNPEVQRCCARALQHLSSAPVEAVLVGDNTTIDRTQIEGDVASRKGLAEALMEKRAADAVAKPGIVSTAVGWLFSGRQRGNASSRQENKSEPPGRRTSNQKIAAPAPCVPPTPVAVPRVELTPPSPHSDTWRSRLGTAGASASKAAGDGRRATSRPAPMVATEAHDDGMSPREDYDDPMTPSVVRSMHRREPQDPSDIAPPGRPPDIQASGQRPLNSPRMRQ